MTTHVHNICAGRHSKRLIAALALSTALALGGCESSSSLFGSDSSSQPETQVAQQPQPVPVSLLPRVAIAPVIGAPDAVGKQMGQDVSSAVAQQKATVVAATDRVDHTLRGYVVAARDRTGVKVSYIWDVTDAQGRRTNRITGEEIIAGGNVKDPWSSVSPQVSQAIAQKTAASFGTWLATQTPPASAAPQPAVASAQQLVAPAASASAATARPAVAAATPPVATPASATSTASLRSNATLVAPLVGAPGDGNNALAEALKAQLAKSGVSMTSQQGATYRVEGVVAVGGARDGKQPIQIDWNVKDPDGKKLGTVTQKNDIPQGSLDGTWGKTADAAAEAAAQGILKLLPKTGTN